MLLTLKDIKFLETKKKLFSALQRLQNGKPTNRDLRRKAQSDKLKINRNTVEKEAGLSVGVLRNHSDVVEAIKNSNLPPEADTQGELDPTSTMEQEQELADVKAALRKQTKLKKENYDARKMAEVAMKAAIAEQVMFVAELAMLISPEKRQEAIKNTLVDGQRKMRHKGATNGNVTHIHTKDSDD